MDPAAPPTVDAPKPAPRFLLPLLVAALTFAAFASGLRGEFLIWDDNYNFSDNPHYRGFSGPNLKWMLTTFHMGHWHPLTWLTLALDYTIWGMNPVGYHLSALLLHSANAVLLFFVIRALLGLAGHPGLRWPAAAGALFYSLHPMRVESVSWITERRDVMCGFFTLLALLFYLRRVEEERAGRPSGKWLALSLAAFAASLLSKALSITLPGVLFLLDVFLLGRFVAGARVRVLGEKVLFGLLSIADAVVMLFAMRHIEAVHEVGSYNLAERAAQASYGLCFYLVKTLWPSPLLPIYPIDPQLDPARPLYVGAMAAVVVLSALAVAGRRRFPALLAAWLCYIVLVFPVLGVAVTGMQIAADRYTYLSLLPAALLVAAALRRAKAPALAGAGLLLAGLALLTARQCRVWKDTITLWNHEIAHHPELYFPYAVRAAGKSKLGDYPGAIADYSRSLEINPNWSIPWSGRGTARAMTGDHEGAIADFSVAVKIDQKYANGFSNRGLSRMKTGDLAGALADFSKSIEIDPAQPDFYKSRAQAWSEAGRNREAVADFGKSLELNPAQPDTRVLRGVARLKLQDARGAMEDFSEALRLRPEPGLYVRRASLRGMTGDLDGSIADATEALRLNPDYYEAYVPRGGARMTRGDKAGAAEDFARALRLAPPDWPRRKQVEQFLREAGGP